MKPKIIAIILVLIPLIFAGCVENGEVVPDDNETDGGTTPVDNNSKNNMTPPEDNDTDVNVTPDVNETANETPVKDPESVLIRLQNYALLPSEVEINKGDTVVWQNFQNDPKRPFTLVSEDRLWENTTIVYRQTFKYTFNETGTYNFSVRPFSQRMSGTITVK